ncbi:MAG: Thiol-disulfide oxidoreductase ResA [bacterium]|nr:Thiol-disulfide oxidoreductase ResA [bacterium]
MTPIRSEADRLALHSQIREKIREVRTKVKIKAPEFPAEAPWLNTGRPLALAELRGKIVLLDFWTYCCINCLHVIPDLKYLEEKYAGRPFVVIGVHSAKFHNERETAHIRQAILRYEVEHPVVVDQDYKIWQAYTVRAWPTLVMIDPTGYLLGVFSGEGNREILDNYIEVGLAVFQEEGKLDNSPLPLVLEQPDRPEALLNFPGKIIAEARTQRLVIADSGHHRLIVCSPDGTIQEIIGSGLAGNADGDFETAHFFHPQGLAWHGEDLIVCDTDNHLLRRVDFGARSVTTIAGTGEQGGYGQRGGAGRKIALNSPWDIFIYGDTGYLAMAGPHQIWSIDLKTNRLEPFAGSGHEARRDGERLNAAFAQPSGIAGEVIGRQLLRLFIADSEISAVRQIDLRTDKVGTLVGGDLFQFGDHDGSDDNVRLQHPLGVCFHDGKVLLADTYNHKIKVLDPNLRLCKTLAGDGKPGLENGAAARFCEPSGLAVLQGRLYVADTNNHAVRVVDLHTKTTATLRLKPQALPVADHLVVMGTPVQRLPEQTLQPGEATLQIRIDLPPASVFNEGSPLQILARSRNQALRLRTAGVTLAQPQAEVALPLQVSASGEVAALRVELVYYFCDHASNLCMMRQAVYEMPVCISSSGGRQLLISDSPA